MQLESLKIYCDVVRCASFSRGAAENGVSQSSASHTVSELEKRLGAKLIDRSKRPLVPTSVGRLYFEGCKDLVSRYYEVENRVRAVIDDQTVTGTVHVVSIYSVGLYHLNQFVAQFQAQHPRAEVRLEFFHPKQVVSSVRDGQAELGLISFPRKWSDLVALPWRDEEMVLALHPAHPLAARAVIDAGELDGLRVVGFDNGLEIRRAVDRWLRRHEATVITGPEFDNIEMIKRAVMELPGGAAILPEPTLARERESGAVAVVRFAHAPLQRPLAVIHRRSGELSLTAQSFLRLLHGLPAEERDDPEAPDAAVAGMFSKRRGKSRRVALGEPT